MNRRRGLAAAFDILRQREGGGRFLLGIRGVPGAGTSTIAERVVDELGPEAVVVPMDHFCVAGHSGHTAQFSFWLDGEARSPRAQTPTVGRYELAAVRHVDIARNHTEGRAVPEPVVRGGRPVDRVGFDGG